MQNKVIAPAKLADIRCLYTYIQSHCHDFYDKLSASDNVCDDYDIFGITPDFQLQNDTDLDEVGQTMEARDIPAEMLSVPGNSGAESATIENLVADPVMTSQVTDDSSSQTPVHKRFLCKSSAIPAGTSQVQCCNVGQDLCAREARYHESCRRDYVRQEAMSQCSAGGQKMKEPKKQRQHMLHVLSTCVTTFKLI